MKNGTSTRLDPCKESRTKKIFQVGELGSLEDTYIMMNPITMTHDNQEKPRKGERPEQKTGLGKKMIGGGECRHGEWRLENKNIKKQKTHAIAGVHDNDNDSINGLSPLPPAPRKEVGARGEMEYR